MWFICLAVPAMAADSIAREKREGTLGLLFLTPLSATGIVLGKGAVLAVRALSLWLAVLPVLTIPFVLGGIGRAQLFCAISMEFCAAVFALAAGLIASALAKSRGVAFALALILAACLVGFPAFFLSLYFFGRWDFFRYYPVFQRLWLAGLTPQIPGWGINLTRSATVKQIGVAHFMVVGGIPLSLLFLFIAVWFSAWCIERSWQDKGPSRQHEELEKRYCTPVFQRSFSRRMQRVLDRNPISWLQQYSWKARLTKWGLCLAFLLIECVVVTIDFHLLDSTQTDLLLILAGAGTFVGVNGFLAEKRNGALELLLVTPVPINKIIIGRAVGLWKQFLPASLLLALCDLANGSRDGELHFTSFLVNYYLPPRLVLACFFLALPFCATYFALRLKNLIAAAVLTWVALFIPPFVAGGLVFFELNRDATTYCTLLIAANFALVLLVCFLLRHSLSRRIYSF
jgi:ABC-type Na+ efflux pump permease subunit